MPDVGFYHLLRTPLDQALPRLMEKVLASGARAVIRTGSEQRAEHLDQLLWTFDPGSFLPHGTARAGDGADQPIWITAGGDAPNGAGVVVLTDGVEEPDLGRYARCLDLFDGRDPDAVARARGRWSRCREAGHALTYWRQAAGGGWEKAEETASA